MTETIRSLASIFGSAIVSGDLVTVKKCVAAGADPNVRYVIADRAEEITAVQYAERWKQDDIVAFLKLVIDARRIPEWSLLGTDKLVHVETSWVNECRLTEVFNFQSRRYHIIDENMSTRAETALPEVSFDELPQGMIQKALGEFRELDGMADEEFVLNGRPTLGKGAFRLPVA